MPAKQTIVIKTTKKTKTKKSNSGKKRGNPNRCPACGRFMWMSKHINIKHKVQSINKKSTFNEILEESMLDEKEKSLMRMYYVEKKDFDFIADTLGYSKAGILKMHKRILTKIESLL